MSYLELIQEILAIRARRRGKEPLLFYGHGFSQGNSVNGWRSQQSQ